jgi:hypothetical protein
LSPWRTSDFLSSSVIRIVTPPFCGSQLAANRAMFFLANRILPRLRLIPQADSFGALSSHSTLENSAIWRH